jgi:hypothetical protein
MRVLAAGMFSVGLVVVTSACGGGGAAPAGPAGSATPVYNERTGRLEALQSDTNDDGKIDTLAHMDGVDLKYIEVDRDYDGRFDRWEYYTSAPGSAGAARSPDGRSVLDHAEEAGGHDDTITRREFYVDGVITRVEEDTTLDGRVDKWEVYEHGVLRRMDLDLDGAGRPTRRLVYGLNGDVERIEADPDGDGTFEVVSPAGKGGRQ